MTIVNPDVVTAAYVASREEIRGLEAQIDKIKEVQKKREDWLLNQMQTQGLQNMKTLHGTVYTSLKESVTVSDGEAFMNWVRETESWEFLNKAANKTAVLERMTEKREVPPPPGVNYSAVRVAQIRKS